MTEHSCWLTATCELVYFVYAEEPVLSLGQNPSAKMDHIKQDYRIVYKALWDITGKPAVVVRLKNKSG